MEPQLTLHAKPSPTGQTATRACRLHDTTCPGRAEGGGGMGERMLALAPGPRSEVWANWHFLALGRLCGHQCSPTLCFGSYPVFASKGIRYCPCLQPLAQNPAACCPYTKSTPLTRLYGPPIEDPSCLVESHGAGSVLRPVPHPG